MASSCGELAVPRGHGRRTQEGRSSNLAADRARHDARATALRSTLPAVVALVLFLAAPPAGAQVVAHEDPANAPPVAEQIAQPDPAAPSPDPAPPPTDAARAAAPTGSEQPAGGSSPSKPASSSAPASSGSPAQAGDGSGSAPGGPGKASTTATSSSAEENTPARTTGQARDDAGAPADRAVSSSRRTAQAPAPDINASTGSPTDSDQTALAGLALLALALAGGCLAAVLARAEHLGLRS